MSYGSNLLAERFVRYLTGGLAPGRLVPQQGARNPAHWVQDAPVEIPHRLHFVGESKAWGGGGVAMIDPEPGAGTTLARAYLITDQQFQDVMAQESGRRVGDEVDLSAALQDGTAVLGHGAYDRVLAFGMREGHPMVTFTTPRSIDTLRPNPPGDAYRNTVTAGLCQAHGLSLDQACAYVDQHAGLR